MTADQLWPDEAREAVRSVVADWDTKTVVEWSEDGVVDAVLAALSAYTVPRAALVGARSDHEFAWAQLNEQTRKLNDFIAAVLDLANEWVAFPNEAMPPHKPLDAHRCAAELRALTRQETP